MLKKEYFPGVGWNGEVILGSVLLIGVKHQVLSPVNLWEGVRLGCMEP